MAVNIIRLIEQFGSVKRREESFAPSAAQTVFNIAALPIDNSDVSFVLNGVSYENGVDFTVSATTVTWVNSIVLDTTDDVEIIYFI